MGQTNAGGAAGTAGAPGGGAAGGKGGAAAPAGAATAAGKKDGLASAVPPPPGGKDASLGKKESTGRDGSLGERPDSSSVIRSDSASDDKFVDFYRRLVPYVMICARYILYHIILYSIYCYDYV